MPGKSDDVHAMTSGRKGPALIGYTAGVFDLFHMGHLNLLRNARAACDMLIVGVTSDEAAEAAKGVIPVIPFLERVSIVQSVRHVDRVVPQTSMDKLQAWHALKFDVLFAGDNLKGTREWKVTEQTMNSVGVEVVYLPATHVRSGELLARGLPDLLAD